MPLRKFSLKIPRVWSFAQPEGQLGSSALPLQLSGALGWSFPPSRQASVGWPHPNLHLGAFCSDSHLLELEQPASGSGREAQVSSVRQRPSWIRAERCWSPSSFYSCSGWRIILQRRHGLWVVLQWLCGGSLWSKPMSLWVYRASKVLIFFIEMLTMGNDYNLLPRMVSLAETPLPTLMLTLRGHEPHGKSSFLPPLGSTGASSNI